MTMPANIQKATAVRNTWVKRCDHYLFISSETNASFPTIGLNVSEGRSHLTAKTMKAFLYVYENYYDKADWFLKADDDTYVIVENLRFLLGHHSASQPIYFGHHFKIHNMKHDYMSGGAGYVLSKEALRRAATIGMKNPDLCRPDGGAEDYEMGRCLKNVGVNAGFSLDAAGRHLFHPLPLIDHLSGVFPNWYFNYAVHPVQKVRYFDHGRKNLLLMKRFCRNFHALQMYRNILTS